MDSEKLVIVSIILSVIVRFLWASLGWPGESFLLFPVYIALIWLLALYYRHLEDKIYKVTVLYFIVYVLAIFVNVLETPFKGFILFLGSLGFILFSIYFFYKRRKTGLTVDNPIVKYTFLFSLVLIVQTVFYVFIPTNDLLTFGHMMSYLIILLGATLLFKSRVENELTPDEKKILTFIIIANVLSLLGVTFKESFYGSIWI